MENDLHLNRWTQESQDDNSRNVALANDKKYMRQQE